MLNIVWIIFIAYIIDLIVGDPYWFPHPVIYMGKYIAFVERLARKNKSIDNRTNNKEHKSTKKIEFAVGIFICLSLIAITSVVTYIIIKIFEFSFFAKSIVSAVIIAITFSTRCLGKEANKVYKALKSNDIKKARLCLSYIVGRQTESLDEQEIIRATVETVAENSVDGTIAPMFYAFIGGPMMAMIYKAVNTMDSMLGYRNERYEFIGKVPAITDDIFNFIPARISIISIAISSIFLKLDWKSCFRISIRDRKKHKSPNCAYPEGAYAGAMNIELGGTNIYFGEEVHKPTIGDNINRLDKENITMSIKILYISTFINFLLLSILTYVIYLLH